MHTHSGTYTHRNTVVSKISFAVTVVFLDSPINYAWTHHLKKGAAPMQPCTSIRHVATSISVLVCLNVEFSVFSSNHGLREITRFYGAPAAVTNICTPVQKDSYRILTQGIWSFQMSLNCYNARKHCRAIIWLFNI